jgi:hypothetical protein
MDAYRKDMSTQEEDSSLMDQVIRSSCLYVCSRHFFEDLATFLSSIYFQTMTNLGVKFREEFSSCSVSGNLEGKWEQMHTVYIKLCNFFTKKDSSFMTSQVFSCKLIFFSEKEKLPLLMNHICRI